MKVAGISENLKTATKSRVPTGVGPSGSAPFFMVGLGQVGPGRAFGSGQCRVGKSGSQLRSSPKMPESRADMAYIRSKK